MQKHEGANSCSNILNLLSDYIDGVLSDSLCRELESHLEACNNCRIVVDTMKKTIELYQSVSNREEVPSDVKERLYIRLNIDHFSRNK
jgi:anti-sigma factor (TIGR02949 family)